MSLFFRGFRRNQTGSVLLLVVMLMSILVFIPIAAQLLTISRKKVRSFSNSDAQALNVARAGLTDAVSWFRNQNSGLPVTSFNPQAADSDNPNVGIIRTGAVSPISSENKLYYQYVLTKISTSTCPNPVQDITARRVDGHNTGEGLVWYLESVGYVFAPRDRTMNPLSGNNLVGRARVATEIRRLAISRPAAAAVILGNTLDNCIINAGGNIAGGSGIAVANNNTGGTPSNTWQTNNDARISGSDEVNTDTTYDLSINHTFGMKLADLTDLSDYRTFASLPPKYPDMALVVLTGNTTFNAGRPLKGGGVLVVSGNLTIASNSGCFFNGLILVTGTANITGDATISGTLMVGTQLTLTGGGEPVYIIYDKNSLDAADSQLTKYRESSATYHVFSSFEN